MEFKIPVKEEKKEKLSPLFSDKDIESWIDEESTITSSIMALLSGPPKVGKSGMALDCRTSEEVTEGKKIFVIEFALDHGSKVNKKEFQNDDPNIIVLSPYVVDCNLETGEYNIDFKKSLIKTKAIIKYVKDNKDKLNIKAIVIDGADSLLSDVCEGQLRIDKSLDAAGGVTYAYWKIRNQYFYQVVNMVMDIDVDRYFITHPKKESETGEVNYGIQKDMPIRMHQILEFRCDKDGRTYVKVVADRRNRPDIVGKEFCLIENENGKRVWKGFRL